MILGVGATPSCRSFCLIFSVFCSGGGAGRGGGPVEASITGTGGSKLMSEANLQIEDMGERMQGKCPRNRKPATRPESPKSVYFG